jgi:hypothetical protein
MSMGSDPSGQPSAIEALTPPATAVASRGARSAVLLTVWALLLGTASLVVPTAARAGRRAPPDLASAPPRRAHATPRAAPRQPSALEAAIDCHADPNRVVAALGHGRAHTLQELEMLSRAYRRAGAPVGDFVYPERDRYRPHRPYDPPVAPATDALF